ncbi:MAG: AMP-dependent synthetase [Flavobacteriaceae bacterium]|nr:MAG: AMP-dependent synthetase [Flavobacteriaceae bacterium]
MSNTPYWKTSKKVIEQSNIYKMMKKNALDNYDDFWQWSVREKETFWEQTVSELGIQFSENFECILNTDKGVEAPRWLHNSQLNIVDSCFQNKDDAVVIRFQKEGGFLQEITQKELENLVNTIANGLVDAGLKVGDKIGIDLPMTVEAVAIYLAGIKAGMPVVTIADSFTSNEISVRLDIAKPKIVFTQDVLERSGKQLPLYTKVVDAKAACIVVIPVLDTAISLRTQDVFWNDFISSNTQFTSVKQTPDACITVLFSSGTTGAPKAIPWTHSTPIKSASDGFYHQDIHTNDVVCWPTNLGWMMGPWLVFATLINKGCIALYYGAPMGDNFGKFIQESKTTMLGVIPSFVKYWKQSQCMEKYDWTAIKCFSSTGEVSNPTEMEYLMDLAGNKPVIEYCGGTEIGGGYVTSTVVQDNYPSTFSSQALGGSFVILDDENNEAVTGEMYLIPPILGMSNTLLNSNHYEVYFKNTPRFKNQVLRRHGDQLSILENGYFIASGRVDDAMNLGGIKVSSIQIESVLNTLEFVKESAAVAIAPKSGGPSRLVIFYVENTAESSKENRLELIKKSIKNQLNPLFKVADLVKITSLPRTASNKVMRRSLRDSYQQ